MIVKCQRNIVTGHVKPQVMIYNQDESYLWTGDMPNPLSWLMGTDYKVFLDVHMEGTEMVIDRKVRPRKW